jgi:hypothetical protein
MARAKWIVGMVLVAGASAASGCAAGRPGFDRQQVREWAMRSEHLRQLHRLVTEAWEGEIAAPRPSAASVGLW